MDTVPPAYSASDLFSATGSGASPLVVDVRRRANFEADAAMIEDFGLADAALASLALIVRGADTAKLDLAPECAGLLAVSLGLGYNYRDDLVLLEKGFLVYDALYAACRAKSVGHFERHSWTYPS